jgi:hypothetical protein
MRGGGDGLDDRRIRVPEDQRPPAAHVVDVAMAVDVGEPGATPLLEEHRGAPHAAEGAHRRVHASGDDPAGAVEEALTPSSLDAHQKSSVSRSCSG